MEDSLSTADKLAGPADLESRFREAVEAAKLEAMAEFAAGAGHEINNPLTIISGRAQLLLRDESDPERRHALALIGAQAMRVYEMIADMMLFARPPRPELQRVELTRLIDGILAALLPSCAAQQTAICRSGEPGPVFVQADPVQLAVALRAMCQNSLEAIRSGGHVEIALETGGSRSATASAAAQRDRSSVGNTAQERLAAAGNTAEECLAAAGNTAEERLASVGDTAEECLAAAGTAARTDSESKMLSAVERQEIRIRICDDGPGLKPEERTHLFDPFYSARQAGRGLGLGLSKAWRIITNHGGRIEVASQPGGGATFTIVLNGLA